MTYSVEYIVNTGQFEHVLWKIEEPNINAFETSMNLMSAGLLEKIGRLGALSKGAVSYGYANPDTSWIEPIEETASPEALIKSELGGTVLETVQKAAEIEPGPTAQPATQELSEVPSRPWNRQPEAKQEKPWTKPATEQPSQVQARAVDLDDFFD